MLRGQHAVETTRDLSAQAQEIDIALPFTMDQYLTDPKAQCQTSVEKHPDHTVVETTYVTSQVWSVRKGNQVLALATYGLLSAPVLTSEGKSWLRGKAKDILVSQDPVFLSTTEAGTDLLEVARHGKHSPQAQARLDRLGGVRSEIEGLRANFAAQVSAGRARRWRMVGISSAVLAALLPMGLLEPLTTHGPLPGLRAVWGMVLILLVLLWMGAITQERRRTARRQAQLGVGRGIGRVTGWPARTWMGWALGGYLLAYGAVLLVPGIPATSLGYGPEASDRLRQNCLSVPVQCAMVPMRTVFHVAQGKTCLDHGRGRPQNCPQLTVTSSPENRPPRRP